MEDLPKGYTTIPSDTRGLMLLSFNPDWTRRPTKDGWYAFRFSYSSTLEVTRIVKCRNLGKPEDSFDLGFSIEHEAMGCIHRNKDQKEFWFAGPIDLNQALNDVTHRKTNHCDSETTEHLCGDAVVCDDKEPDSKL
jgi:hypothetical protein